MLTKNRPVVGSYRHDGSVVCRAVNLEAVAEEMIQPVSRELRASRAVHGDGVVHGLENKAATDAERLVRRLERPLVAAGNGEPLLEVIDPLEAACRGRNSAAARRDPGEARAAAGHLRVRRLTPVRDGLADRARLRTDRRRKLAAAGVSARENRLLSALDLAGRYRGGAGARGCRRRCGERSRCGQDGRRAQGE
jgi:hypothetical protein